MNNSKVIFITHPYYGINNPSNNYRIYKKSNNAKGWSIINCKNKESYSKKIKEYISGFYEYSRDEKKAHETINSYVDNSSSSMFDYFMGGKKEEETLNHNQMKREEMAMIKTGEYITDKDVINLQKNWINYIENSNIQMSVLSFNQDYIDANISVKELQKKITIDLMPKFLSYCGHENPKDNLEWIVALHNDRENNYHFHISWIEKNKSFRNRANQINFKNKLILSDKEINFMKRQSCLTVERKRLYTPAVINLESKFDDLKKYFNPNDNNFTLKNIDDVLLEEKIIKLGFLLNEIRTTDKKYIKYNSLPKNEIGNETRKLVKEIKKEIFKNYDLKIAKEQINSSIERINELLTDIDKRNNISNIGFEDIKNNKMIQEKLLKNENYIMNAIVNHALYNYEYNRKNIKKDNFCMNDILMQVSYENYIKDYENLKFKKYNKTQIKLLKNFLRGKKNKSKCTNAFDRLAFQQEKIIEEFYKMFEDKFEKEMR